MSGDTPALPEIVTTAPRRRGRKPGSGKVPGSGRKPGSKNKVSADIRETIMARGRPIELLCDIARGVKIRVGPQAGPGDPQYAYPTLQERAAAAKLLLDKLVPAASPEDGEPLHPPAPPMSDRELAYLLAHQMAKAASDARPGQPIPKTPAGIMAAVLGEPMPPEEEETAKRIEDARRAEAAEAHREALEARIAENRAEAAEAMRLAKDEHDREQEERRRPDQRTSYATPRVVRNRT